MICYPEFTTEVGCHALDDYWLISDESPVKFVYTIKEVEDSCRAKGARIPSGGLFFKYHPAFICDDCHLHFPVSSRSAYTKRMRSNNDFTCNECLEIRLQQEKEDAHKLLEAYKSENFQATFNIETLTAVEILALLSLPIMRSNNTERLLGETPEDISITGVDSVDQQILISLMRKGVINYISYLPSNVENALSLLYGYSSNITYDRSYGYYKKKRYRHPESIVPGIYLNNISSNSEKIVSMSSVSALLYQKLQLSTFSLTEITAIKQLINEVQLDKLYRLVQEISKEYVIPIDNSHILNALLDHLSKKYSPLCINFTFNVKARDAVVYMRKASAPDYIAKNYFTKFVGDYVQLIESKGWTLEKTWSLPPTLPTSPFEAIFSNIYLNDHFDWNRLSASEVVALWLENVQFSESAQNLLADESGSQD